MHVFTSIQKAPRPVEYSTSCFLPKPKRQGKAVETPRAKKRSVVLIPLSGQQTLQQPSARYSTAHFANVARRGVDPNPDPNPDPTPNPNPNPDPNQAPYVVAAAMLTLFFSVLLAETPLQNSVSLTAELTNGEAKTYKLLLDIDVR